MGQFPCNHVWKVAISINLKLSSKLVVHKIASECEKYPLPLAPLFSVVYNKSFQTILSHHLSNFAQ